MYSCTHTYNGIFAHYVTLICHRLIAETVISFPCITCVSPVLRVPLPLCTPGGRISYFWKNTHGDSQIFYFFINKQDDSKGV